MNGKIIEQRKIISNIGLIERNKIWSSGYYRLQFLDAAGSLKFGTTILLK
jgi:hypothetical protein